ncbi:MAG: SurA N-terminal domain-containing protein [Minwuiales bacterium]|nr:SurA N-terminal domain-containing protein [Minwuiales bacterium]
MLNAMRQKSGSWITKVFLGLLVASFAVWGVGDYVSGGGDVTVAEVGDAEVSGIEFQEQLRRSLVQMQQQFGQVIDPEQAAQLGLDEAALQQIVARLVVDQGTARLGLDVPDSVVVDDIRNNPSFRNSLGHFDQFQFHQILAQNGWTEEVYVDLAKRDIARNQLVGTIGAGAEAAPGLLVDELYKYRMERRFADYIVLPNERITQVPTPTEAELEAFHQEHARRFTAPEYRTIAYATISAEDLLDEIEIGEAELRDEYDQRIDEFTVQETREIAQLLFAEQAEAEKAYEMLQSGSDFATVARDLLDEDVDDLSLGRVIRADLPAELSDAAFALGDGEASRPLQTDFGWHVLRATGIQPGRTRSFEEVKDTLREDVGLSQATDALFELSETIEDELAGGAGLEDTAAAAGLTVRRIEKIDSVGQSARGAAPADLPGQPEFLATAFATEMNAELELIESADGSYLLLEVEDIVDPALRPLDEVREAVIDSWRADQRNNANAEAAEAIVTRVEGGASLAAVATELDVPLVRSEPITRGNPTNTDTALPATLLSNLFDMDINGVATAANPLDGSHVVAVLTEVRDADPLADAELTASLQDQLATGMAADLLRQYQVALEQQIGVRIDRDAMAASANPHRYRFH